MAATDLQLSAGHRPSVVAADGSDIIDLRDRPSASRIPYFSGLDGLRGVAVIAVLCFHGGFSWAVGGYLGVSTFFTLSGFLITLLLLSEARSDGRIDLKGFYKRRLRRLLPASLAAVALAIAYAAVAGSAAQQRNIGGDVAASLADVANWHFILQHVSYADLFTGPSPLLHFWSLAIEEQFYLLFPLLVGAIAIGRRRRGRHLRDAPARRRRFVIVVAGLMIASLSVTLLAGYSKDRIYFGTETRSFELLAGVLVAAVLLDPRVASRLTRARTAYQVGSIGAAAGVVCVVLWATADQSSAWLYRGGLAGYSVASCAVILAAISPRGPVRLLLSSRPLRRVGELSYGIYVYHWPVFLFLDSGRTGLAIWPLFALRLAVTALLAMTSATLLERPVRQQRFVLSKHRLAGLPCLAVGAVVTVIILLGASWMVTRDAGTPTIDFAAVAETLDHVGDDADVAPANSAGVLRPARVAVFGDSTAATVAGGLAMTNSEQVLVTEVQGAAKLGCPLGRGGQIRSQAEHFQKAVTADCSDWPDQFSADIDAQDPDIAMVLYGPWDVLDRKLPHDDKWRGFGDPTYDAYMKSEMLAAVDVLASRGALVVWLTTPPVRGDQARVDRMNQLIEQLPSERPDKVVVLDLEAWVASTGDPPDLRPDHIHIAPEAAAGMSRQWLIPQLRWLWVSRVAQDPTRANTAAH